MSTARCAMSLDQTETAVEALLLLNREFPHDPDVLYQRRPLLLRPCFAGSAGTCDDSSNIASGGTTRSGSFRVAAETGIRPSPNTEDSRAGTQNWLAFTIASGASFFPSRRRTPRTAKSEFTKKLKIDPDNASAEFMLGEIARQSGQWEEAVGHFSRASKLDEGFQEAYLALGMSLNSAGKFSDAIAPLQSYVKMQPGDPAGHYQLATAYARTGHKPEADREMALQREAAAKSPRARRQIK